MYCCCHSQLIGVFPLPLTHKTKCFQKWDLYIPRKPFVILPFLNVKNHVDLVGQSIYNIILANIFFAVKYGIMLILKLFIGDTEASNRCYSKNMIILL